MTALQDTLLAGFSRYAADVIDYSIASAKKLETEQNKYGDGFAMMLEDDMSRLPGEDLKTWLARWTEAASKAAGAYIDHIVDTCVHRQHRRAVIGRLCRDDSDDMSVLNIPVEVLGTCAMMHAQGAALDFTPAPSMTEWRNELGSVIWGAMPANMNAVLGNGHYNDKYYRPMEWPREAAVNDVLNWITEGQEPRDREWAKKLLARKDWGVGTRTAAKPFDVVKQPGDGNFFSMAVDGDAYRLLAFAWVYIANKDVQKVASASFMGISTTREHHALLSSMRDMPKDPMRHRGDSAEVSTFDGRVEIIAPDGSNRPIQLTLPSEGFNDDIVMAIRTWRGAEGLRNWAAIIRQLTDGGRTGTFKWTLDAHLRALGKEDWSRKPKKKADVSRLVELLTKFELVVYDKNNRVRARAPLLHVVDGVKFDTRDGDEDPWSIGGMMLKINPWLYHGVRNSKTNDIGSNWFPQAASVAMLDHVNYEAAITLGLLLPMRWRWNWGDNRASFIDITASKLISVAGIKRSRLDKAWETLERNLNKLKEVGGLGSYEWLNAKNTLDGMVRLHMPQKAVDHLVHEVPIRELPAATMPTNGAELREWRERRGMTQAQVATLLGVSLNTVEKSEGKPDKQLGPSIRKAMPAISLNP